MSMALEDICRVLKLNSNAKAREIVALRIIDLTREGVRSPIKLRDRILEESNSGTRC